MKKLLALAVVAAVSMSMFAGCAAKSDPASPGGGGGGTDAAVIGTWDLMSADGATVVTASYLVITSSQVTEGGSNKTTAGTVTYVYSGGNEYYDYDYAGLPNVYAFDYTVSGDFMYRKQEATSASTAVTLATATHVFKKHV